MNPNPYPHGRWTLGHGPYVPPRKATLKKFTPESIADLVQVPLRELFWGIPESKLLEEAKQRIENAVLAAVSGEPAPCLEPQPELAAA